MIADLYIAQDSCVHRAPPARKIVALAVFSTLVFLAPSWLPLAVAAGVLTTGYALAGITVSQACQPIRPMLWLLSAIFATQIVLSGIDTASFVIARLVVLILAASIVTMSTRTGEFVEGILAVLQHAPRWVPVNQIALAVSLTLRLIPSLRLTLEEIRTAQRARHLDGSIKALLVPLIVRTLRKGDEMAEAIYARSGRQD